MPICQPSGGRGGHGAPGGGRNVWKKEFKKYLRALHLGIFFVIGPQKNQFTLRKNKRSFTNAMEKNSAEIPAAIIPAAPAAGRKPKRRKADKWAAYNVERRDPAKLKPRKGNPRTHTEAQVDQIIASINQWGWTTPILIDGRGGIIAGHGRHRAALKMELPEVPVIVAKGWTAEQVRAYVIADNQLPQNAGWDKDLLALEVGELSLAGFDIALLGFDAAGLEGILKLDGFAPNLLPGQGGEKVDGEDVNEAARRLAGEFLDKSKQNILTVTCPHCGQDFGLNKDAL